MAITLNNIQTYFKDNFKLSNLYGRSKYSVLFPNELQQDGGGWKAEVYLPIINESITQKDWDPNLGFTETYVTEDFKKVQLDQNFTVYNRIANQDKLASNWPANKLTITDSQKAKILDKYIIKVLCTNVANKITSPIKITKDNFVTELKRLQAFVLENDIHLEDCIIFIDPEVVSAMINAKIQYSKATIEGTLATITSALGFNFVEAPIKQYGHLMVPIAPQAMAWVLAIDVPLQAGQYTQGRYLGQLFIANNEFYYGEVVQNKFWFSYPDPDYVPPSSTRVTRSIENVEQLENAKRLALDLVLEAYDGVPHTKERSEYVKKINDANKLDDVYKTKEEAFKFLDTKNAS
ncbi:hypothetical protein [Spiroplasma endosymbiont of Sarcophaga carnaria]|uniref:hypothetical protein n=1 Tax=Spiroplasma endosymbiont of Sarcophaga carnaria TaxID=3066303 RepID=UPI0030D166D0